ncbi:acyltransferase family-domain-containing protein [Mariannaea sp. PMI_226]|nr:acyltransferase family-domain-containing protein [Mariannaea sp. PMI_226]
MSSPRDGILNGRDFESIDFNRDVTFTNGWKPARSFPKSITLKGRSWKLWPKALYEKPEKLRPTAWLDGLRGFAALIVYFHHHSLWVHDEGATKGIFENGFGFDGKYYLATFPVIRNFFTGGHFAVSTFFVISGYVLSLTPLSLIHAGEYVKLGDNISSALFRRWLRLYLPIIATVVISIVIRHALSLWTRPLKLDCNLLEDLRNFYLEFKNFSFVFKEGGGPWLSYNMHLWSIPVEFRGSIVIYTSLVAFSRCSRNARLLCQVGLIYYFMFICDGWYCATFVAGMLLCDLDLLAKRGELPTFIKRLEPAKGFIYYHLLIFSLLLSGVPSASQDVEQLAKIRGWYYLSLLKPQAVFDYKWFYLFWASVWLVAAIPRITWLKRFFETRFCQYLGRTSFGLYMIHGPVLWTLGDRLYTAAGWHTAEHLQNIPRWADKLPFPNRGPVGLEISFLVPHIVLIPVTFALAELVTRAIDTPSVKFASWFYRWAIGGTASQPTRVKA